MNLSNKCLIGVMCVLVALFSFLTFTACTMVLNCNPEVAPAEGLPKNGDSGLQDAEKEMYNIVVAGTDKGGGRTDVIMLVHLNVTDKKAAVLSIPRDTYISTSRASKKINACNSYGGAKELCGKIKETFGIKADYYAIIDLNVFTEIVDLLGGVEVNLSRDMYYVDKSQNLYINLKAGRQVLNGKQAEGFVRFRSGYAMADLTRIEAQKIFAAALVKELFDSENIIKLPSVISAVFSKIDTNIELTKLFSLAIKLVGTDLESIKMYTLPGEAYMKNGVSYFSLYKEETLALINMKFNPSGVPVRAQDTTMTELGRLAYNQFDYNGKSLAELAGAMSPKR